MDVEDGQKGSVLVQQKLERAVVHRWAVLQTQHTEVVRTVPRQSQQVIPAHVGGDDVQLRERGESHGPITHTRVRPRQKTPPSCSSLVVGTPLSHSQSVHFGEGQL